MVAIYFKAKNLSNKKRLAGWKARYILSDYCAFSVLEKTILGFGKVWYCPKGPGVGSKEELSKLIEELTPYAKKQGVFSIKIEPPLDHAEDLTDLGLIKTKPVQYNYATVLIDLSPDLDTIMANFNQKGRHAIKRAERDGVTVKQVAATDENCKKMYDLFIETSKSAKFAIRPAEYYREFYYRYEASGNGQLILCLRR